ncbi:hypothetical protein COO60DRAFT_1642070 [Scenedesmus sp. NREL 46B-D3]|nr:hypothetical protein COO60DRAFT_1642070 [Scenedesmus sp. NREL 46B-D3]
MAKSAALYEVLGEVAKTGGSSTATSATDLPGLLPAGQVFVCPEESLFYSQAVEKLVLSRPDCPASLVEFGAGDGSPIISALLKVPPVAGRAIHAYEISPASAQLAAASAARVGLGDTYLVHNSCFWEDNDIMMPGLWGGRDGAGLTRELLLAGFDTAMLLISAYSNPVLTLQHARDQGYAVEDFLCAPLPFGTYSSEPRVRQWITEMKERGEAFYSRRGVYMLAAVLFKKQKPGAPDQADLTDELLRVLTVL